MKDRLKTMNPVLGKVVRMSADSRTAKIEVPSVVVVPKYGKRLRRAIHLTADTTGIEVKLGNMVGLLPSRRTSKTKSWRVVHSAQG